MGSEEEQKVDNADSVEVNKLISQKETKTNEITDNPLFKMDLNDLYSGLVQRMQSIFIDQGFINPSKKSQLDQDELQLNRHALSTVLQAMVRVLDRVILYH